MELQYERVYESISGGWVDLHPLHGADELPENLEACIVIADHGISVELLPCLPANELVLRQQFLPDVFGNKNPDVRINKLLIGDIKTLSERKAVRKATINNAINTAASQRVEVVILNLINRQYAVQDIKKGIVGALQPERNRSIRFVWIITRSRNLFMIDREKVFDDSIYEALNYL
ncbi:MAG: hypothetical protein J7621_03885 [Niastella sp.]|nr:hypothetical protein [Niastella sp.]